MAEEEGTEATRIWQTDFSKKTRVDLTWKPRMQPNNDLNHVGDEFTIDLEDGVKVKVSLRIAERLQRTVFYEPVVAEMAVALPLPKRIASLAWNCCSFGSPCRPLSEVDLSLVGNGHCHKLAATKEVYLCDPLQTVYVAFEFVLEDKESPDVLTSGLNKMMQTSVLTDVVLLCQGKEFPCHRNILAAQSSVFYSMLIGDSFKESKDGVAKIDDMTPEELKIMLGFLYTKEATQLKDNPHLSMRLLAAANKYNLQELTNKCVECLESCLTHENVFEVVTLATMHNIPRLKRAATAFILSNGPRILSSVAD